MRDALYNGKSGIVYDPVRKEMGFRSALTAIGLGALLIQNGLQEMVVCGGAQEAHPDTYIEVLVNNAGIKVSIHSLRLRGSYLCLRSSSFSKSEMEHPVASSSTSR